MDSSKVLRLLLHYYPLLFLFGYFYCLNAFFNAARKYDEDFYGQLGRPNLFLNNSFEVVDLFLRCMWFKRYFGRDKRVVARAKVLRSSFFIFLLAVATYPFARAYLG